MKYSRPVPAISIEPPSFSTLVLNWTEGKKLSRGKIQAFVRKEKAMALRIPSKSLRLHIAFKHLLFLA